MAVHFFPENPTSGGGTDPGFITLTGDISGSGSGTIPVFLPAITTGRTSTKITFNAKGQVTAGTSLTDLDLPPHSHNVTILGDVTGTGTNSSITTSLVPVTTAGSGIKISYDDKGRVLSSEGLTTIDLPIHTHSVTISGDVTGTGTNSNITTSLPIITSPGQATKVSYTAKGLVYAGTSLSDTDLPAHNHPVTMTGDVTGTGTNSNIATILASITTGKTSTKVTFNDKGLILSGTTLSDTDLPPHTHTVTLAGDVTGTGSNSSITTSLPTITSANTATKITYTAKGLVTGGTTLSDTDLPPHPHTINVSGDVAGTGLNSALTLTLPNIATAGTYPKVLVNAKGQVTSGSGLLASDIPSLDWAKITTGKPTTIGGYGIADAYTKLEIDGSLSNKQNLSNELTALSSLADTTGFIRKTGDGTYTIDTSVYLTTSAASSSYQPLNTNLTGVSGLTGLDGIAKKTGGVWSLDTNSYLTGNQLITLSGDITGSGATSIVATLPNVVTAGSSAKPAYNAKGLITAGGSLLASDIPSLDWSKITTGKPTTLNGYGITDALTIAGNGLTSIGNTINAVGTPGRVVVNADSIDLATIGTVGTYAKITTDAYGRVVSGSNLLASDIPNLDASKITSGLYSPFVGNLGFAAGDSLSLFTLSYQSSNGITLRTEARRNITSADWKGTETRIQSRVDITKMGYISFRNDWSTPRIYLGTDEVDVCKVESGIFSVLASTASTSTTTGALVVGGGVGVIGDMYANLFNGHHQLKTFTTATRPTPSTSTLGQIWLNTTTGKIEYVATATTIQSITST